MISSLDYLDIDASDNLSLYIGPRVKYGAVIRELEKVIDVNIYANYLRTFDSMNSNYYSLELARLLSGNTVIQEIDDFRFLENYRLYTNHKCPGWLLELAHDLYTNHKCPGWLSNFPTKQPTWTPLVRRKGELILNVKNDDYIIDGLGWKLKKFPPDKNKYQVDNLSLLPST